MAKKENEIKQKNSYFKGMKQELKKVVWPTPKELVNNTVAVIAFVIIIGVIVFILDLCFDNINKYGITKLQEKVQSSFKTTEDSENSAETESTEDTNETQQNSEEIENNEISEDTSEIEIVDNTESNE